MANWGRWSASRRSPPGPTAARIVPVVDDPNTHELASLHEAFPVAEARRLAERLEVRDTPKHGSGWDVAETEWRVRSRQCRDRRIDDAGRLAREIAAWERQRNEAGTTVDWPFTAPDVRVKLKRLSPSIGGG